MSSKLSWSQCEFDKTKTYAKIPEPKLNGGWYTGEPFEKGAKYATVPVVPDEGYLTSFNLLSANPPPLADIQYNNFRPGNNIFGISELVEIKNNYITCYKNK